jgi:hypothetical protein
MPKKANKRETPAAIHHTVTVAEIEAQPELAEAGVAAGDTVTIEPEDTVPTFTVRADSDFGIRCMVMIRDLAISTRQENAAEISTKLREFDLWEELNRVTE